MKLFFDAVAADDHSSRSRWWPTASTNSADRRRRCLSATTYDVNEQQRCSTTMITSHGVNNGTPWRRNAWGFNVTSLTSTINVVDDCWHPLPVR